MSATLKVNGTAYTSAWRQELSSFSARAHMGESTQSEFVLDDDDGTMSHLDLASRKVVELWEDASGTAVCLWRGRMMDHTVSRGDLPMGLAAQWQCSAEDYNIDLRGIRIDGESRSAENDGVRVLAIRDAYLAGTASTSTRARDTTSLGTAYIDAAGTVALVAEEYDNTDPAEVLRRICEVSGKTYFAFVDDDGNGQLYYAATTDTSYASDISITDAGTADGTDSYAPIYITRAGSHSGQHLISGGAVYYNQSSAMYEESDIGGVAEGFHDKWEENFTDDYVSTEAEATALLRAIVKSRSNERITYSCAIKMRDSQVHRIKAGMTLSVRMAAANLESATTLRAVQVQYQPVEPGWYIVEMELGWPRGPALIRNQRRNPPKAPTPASPGTSVRLYHSGDRAGSGDSDEAQAAPALSSGAVDAAWDYVAANIGFANMMYASPQNTVGGGGNWTSVNAAAGYVVTESHIVRIGFISGLLAIIQAGGSVRQQARANARYGTGISESAQEFYATWCGRIYRPSTSSFVATLWSVGDWVGSQKFPAQATKVNRTWRAVAAAYASCAATDYLVIESGAKFVGPTSGGTGCGIHFDDQAASDLPEDETTTTDLNSWVEFATAGSAGDTPSDTVAPGSGSAGSDTGTYAPIDHTHGHGLLSSPYMHGALTLQPEFTSSDSDPTANDDADDGYRPGWEWVNDSTGDLFMLVDATVGAAVWRKIYPSSGSVAVEDDEQNVQVDPTTTIQFEADDFAVSDEGSGVAKVTFVGTAAGAITVEEDGDTPVANVDHIVFDGATVTDDGGGQVTVSGFGAGGGGASETWEDVMTDLSANLVHRWKFEEASGNFADSVGSLTLTASGTWTYGVAGGPISGSAGSAQVGASARGLSSGLGSIPTGASARTVILVYVGASAGGSDDAFWSYGSASTRQWFTGIEANPGLARLAPFGDDLDVSAPVEMAGVPHMFACVYDGAQGMLVFFDGIIGFRRPGAALNTASGGNFSIAQDAAGGRQMAASILYDDLTVFDRALTLAELWRLWRTII